MSGGQEQLHGILEGVASLACQTIEECDAAAVAVIDADGGLAFVAGDREVDVQGQAPVDAVRTGETQCVDGPVAFLAVPLLMLGSSLGVLILGGRRPGAFADGEVQRVGEVVAQHAAVAIALAQLMAAGDEVYGALAQSHDVIDQAHGVLMARLHCDAASAAAELAADAARQGRSLDELAASVVASTQAGGN